MSIDRLPPVGHVGVVVADMDRALEEIRQIFGIDGAGKVYDFTPMNVWAWGEKIPGCQIRIAMLDWTDSLKLEVLQPVFGEIEHKRFVDEVGAGCTTPPTTSRTTRLIGISSWARGADHF